MLNVSRSITVHTAIALALGSVTIARADESDSVDEVVVATTRLRTTGFGALTSLAVVDRTDQLWQRVKPQVGISIEVKVDSPGNIERSAGKAKRVIYRRKLS